LSLVLKNTPRELRHYLQGGGVIAYPTEAIFGLGCDPSNRKAVQRLLRLKRRPQRKGLILIASHLSQLKPYIAPLSKAHVTRVQHKNVRPHTWLVPKSRNCPVWISGNHETIAVRITTHPLSAGLCHSAGALVSTSANRSGGTPARTVRECYKLFGTGVKIINGMVGRARKPSTIEDLITGKIIRP